MSAPSAPTPSLLPDYLGILLDSYRNHPIVGDALVGAGSEPGRFFGWLFGDDSLGFLDMLSGGEKATFELALCLWNGREFDLSRLHLMDDAHRLRAATAIQARFSPLWGKE